MSFAKLSEVEMMIMHTVWKLGDNHTVYQVIQALSEDYGKQYSPSTVKTYLSKLKKKGFIKTYVKGNYSYIVSLMDKEEYQTEQMQKMKDFWYEGSAASLFSTLTKTITKEEVEELKGLLDDLDS